MAMVKNFPYPHLFFQKPGLSDQKPEPTPIPDRYEYLNLISEGSYGKVYRARDNETGEIVAMKMERHGFSESTLREINILRSLPRHPCIVDYKEVFVDKKHGENRAFVVMEYLECDLSRFMDARKKPFHIRQVKVMMQKILQGVLFLHQNNVMHRDLKPSNILMGPNCSLKICDFGLSRRAECDAFGSYSPRVGTRLYQAPELLVGEDEYEYSSAVDMWSVGCIMAELVLREYLFDADSDIEQFSKIHELVLEPSNLFLRRKFSVAAASSGAPLLTELGFDLLLKLLDFNPRKRISAKDALNHPWLTE